MLPPLQGTEGRIFMNDITKAFSKGKAFIPFVTAGYPNMETTEKLLIEISENGADIIEIGIPFSDPVAGDVAMQETELIALENGTTTDKIFDMIQRIRPQIKCKLAIMTYMNPIFVYGTDKFMKKCSECGISAVIVPDTPFEEKEELLPSCNAHNIALISLIAPASKERIKTIAKEAQGFIYCVYPVGEEISDKTKKGIEEMLSLIKEVTDTPCAIDFGISSIEQTKEMSQYGNGIIAQSAIINICKKHRENCLPYVADYIKAMREAVK